MGGDEEHGGKGFSSRSCHQTSRRVVNGNEMCLVLLYEVQSLVCVWGCFLISY